ncbi:hypothetical protein KW784_01075 [Candidatus Parcubacteria bacterium]|nr:hypothetical protein [Candidatus Parcubacteria bacterium]
MEHASLPKKFKLVIAAVICLALGAFILTGFLWMRLQDVETKVAGTDSETSQIVGAVGEHLLLPEGEEPELLTVSDLSQVAGQPFFANALVGDKVLVYKQASKAVLWRPSEKKVIEVYPINLSAQ